MFWNFSRVHRSIAVRNLNDLFKADVDGIDIALGYKESAARTPKGNRVYVIDFNGDVMASQSDSLSHEVTAIIAHADPKLDSVLVRLESPGGVAHAYGYAASQLQRLRDAGLYLTVSVDRVAASGGYMMAVIGNQILAAPFAIVGSVGVVTELLNFNEILNSIGVKYLQYTAGKYKRTISLLGKITEEGEAKFKEDLNEVYVMFRGHVKKFRPHLDMDRVATGEHWSGLRAKELGLVDELITAEDYIMKNMNKFEFIKISYIGEKKTLSERIAESMTTSLVKLAWSTYNFISTFEKFKL